MPKTEEEVKNKRCEVLGHLLNIAHLREVQILKAPSKL